MNGTRRHRIAEPPSFRPKKCPACGQSIRTGRRRNKWGFTGVSYNRRDRCFHSTIRMGNSRFGSAVVWTSRCCRAPEEAARLRARAMMRLIRTNKVSKAANLRWRHKNGRERSKIPS